MRSLQTLFFCICSLLLSLNTWGVCNDLKNDSLAQQANAIECATKASSPSCQNLLKDDPDICPYLRDSTTKSKSTHPEAVDLFGPLKEKMSCLNTEGQWLMRCYIFFSVIDPTLLLGFAGKAPALFKAMGAAGKSVALKTSSKIAGIMSRPGFEYLSQARWFPKYTPGRETGVYVNIGLDDRPSVYGKLISEDATSVTVEVASGENQRLPKKLIKFLNVDPEVEALRTFVREEESITSAKPNFLANMKDAQAKAADYVETAISGRTPSQFEFENNHLRAQHRVVTGQESGRTYEFSNYSSTDAKVVGPGQFRDEIPTGRGQFYTETAHLDSDFERLKALGIQRKESPVIRDLEQELKDAKQRGDLTGKEQGQPANLGAQHFYPEANTLPTYRRLISTRFTETIEAIKNMRKNGGQVSIEAMDAVADYYHTAINSHLFGRVNHSLFMTDVNAFLGQMRLQPVAHGDLDFFAISMDFKDFRKLFRTYVRDQNI